MPMTVWGETLPPLRWYQKLYYYPLFGVVSVAIWAYGKIQGPVDPDNRGM